jgi:archaemetzincin
VKYSTYDNLGLIQVGPTTHYSLNTLKEQVSRRFPRYQVETLEPIVEPAEAYDSFRDQYHSTRILVILEELLQTAHVELLLGVAPLDLYVPNMNFVFGEARCPGRVAVISTFRLRPQTRSNPQLFGNRVAKEAVHEIGHMLGLKHCPNALCVMYFSERLADTDRKQEGFCAECDHSLKWLEVE